MRWRCIRRRRVICGKMDIRTVVEEICELEPGDIADNIAGLIYDRLDSDAVHRYVERWFDEQDPQEYDKWFRERNEWPEGR